MFEEALIQFHTVLQRNLFLLELGTAPQYKSDYHWSMHFLKHNTGRCFLFFFYLPAAMSLMLAAPAPSFYSQYAQPLVPKIQQSSIHKPHFLDFKQASPTVDIIGPLSFTPHCDNSHRLLPGLLSCCSPQSSISPHWLRLRKSNTS